jgi:pyruvate dehydrogenase complex dehydrogenase (E1) component
LVPIIPDEARTFGMEGFFKKLVFMLMKAKNMSQKMLHN